MTRTIVLAVLLRLLVPAQVQAAPAGPPPPPLGSDGPPAPSPSIDPPRPAGSSSAFGSEEPPAPRPNVDAQRARVLAERARVRAERERARAEVRRIRQQQRAARLRHRMLPRRTFRAGVGAGFLDIYERRHGGTDALAMTGAQISVGWRRNFASFWGAQVNLNALFGRVWISNAYRQDLGWGQRSAVRDFSLELGFFANLGRFYGGPMASVGHRSFSRESFELFDGPYPLTRIAGGHAALGGQVGLLLFSREQVDLGLRLQSDLPEGDLQVFFSIGYHFMAPS